MQELLVLRCKRGEHQALSELIRQWEDRLFYYVPIVRNGTRCTPTVRRHCVIVLALRYGKNWSYSGTSDLTYEMMRQGRLPLDLAWQDDWTHPE
ncbi:MAG: hypothetical protein A2W31_04190 [Planctomycetes bacterium RBG_16_64_10]|nr:MAG: hypothetical protein A2W31_04190 [Planctomycetes bacterium RBG_16_64_10]